MYLTTLDAINMRREKALETIKELPGDFDLDDLIEKLIFIEKVEQGIHQSDEGKTISHETVKEMAKKW